MAKTAFRFAGGKELNAALGEFAKPMQKAVMRRALNSAAEPILDYWQAGTNIRTGHLQRSETIGGDSALNKRQRRIVQREGKSEAQVHVGTNDQAGRLEEFGSVNNFPNPALTRAWEAQGGQKAVDRVSEELAKDIDRTAKRLGRGTAKG